MSLQKINLKEKLSQFTDHWNPRGVEHRPVAVEEAHILLFEPANTLNTGDAEASELTRQQLQRI